LVVVNDSDSSQELTKGVVSAFPIDEKTNEMELTAIEIAMSASVTVSIGELTKGVLRVILRVILVSTVTSLAAKSILAGRSRKSL
jgi:hypothetical protein